VGTLGNENSNHNKINREDSLLSQQCVGTQSGVLKLRDGSGDGERLKCLLELHIFFVSKLPDDGSLVPKHAGAGA
jgi:hypothetical protein